MAGSQQRGIRNKCKQILLIEEHPDFLYNDKISESVIITIAGKRYNIGKINSELKNEFIKMENIDVEIIKKNKIRTKGIDGFKGLKVRKLPRATTIEVSASTQEALIEKIIELKDVLSNNDIESTERCSWICTIDKGKNNEPKELVDNNEPKELVDNNEPEELVDNNEPKELVDNNEPKELVDNTKNGSIENLKRIAKLYNIDNINKGD